MSRSIDHLVLPVRDLAAVADFYRRLGFSVGRRNVHPFGTENHIIRLERSYLELIGLQAGFQPPPSDPQSFSFPAFIAAWLQRREGLAMLALASSDAVADAKSFAAAGIGGFVPLRFERDGEAADGSAVRLGFTLAFAQSPLIEAAGFFTCQHASPAAFWGAGPPPHGNTARRLLGVALVAENPSDHAEFFGALLCQRMMLATSMGVEIETGDGPQKVEILTPTAARFRLGDAAAGADTAIRFIAYRLGVADLAACRRSLEAENIDFVERAGALIVAAARAFGVTIVFEPL